MKAMKKNIVLASASPRRKELLKRMGLKNFRVIPPEIDENPGKRFLVKALKRVALEKALAVSKRENNCLIIAADTVVVVKGLIYGKPVVLKKARSMLRSLSGTTQAVWTAVAVVENPSGRSLIRACISKIRMKILSSAEIEYLAAKNLDKAGGYGIQEDDKYLTVLKGSRTNIVGLPTELLSEMLVEFGIKTKPVVKYKF